MAENETLQKAIELVKLSIEKRKTVNQICLEEFNGRRRNFVAKEVYSLDEKFQNGTIKREEYEEFLKVWNEYLSKKDSFPTNDKKNRPHRKISQILQKPINYDQLTDEEKVEVKYDAYEDDKYDDRSNGKILRDPEEEVVIDEETGQIVKKIVGYKYYILIRGEEPLEGELTREEMNMVYRLYSNLDGAGLTLRAVSRHFKHLTFKDFKRIVRAFHITKQSIPVAPHIIEENHPDKVVDIVFRNKENNLLKKIEDERGKHVEKILKETQRELIKLKSERYSLKALFEDIQLNDVKPLKIKKISLDGKKRALVVYLSDQHVGAHTKEDSLYNNKYDEKEFERRMQVTFEHVMETYHIFGRFDKIIICNVGDSLDGFDEKTTRGGHGLPQNMDNKKQFSVYIEKTLMFFDALHEANICNGIEYQCVSDDNHSGDFGYMANKALSIAFGLKYPDMHVNLFDRFIETFFYGDHTFVMCHGKDREDMRGGFPLNLDTKTENYFQDYISNLTITTPHIHVISGDLHQSLRQYGKRFRWKKVASMYGSSKWIHTNFGNTKAAVDFEVVSEKDSTIFESRVTF